MNIDEIMKRFAVLAGLTAAEAEPWRTLCEDALVRIQTQCREDVDTAEQSSVLCAAVSALAFYQYALCSRVNEDGDFTAGEVKFSGGTHGAQCAERLWLDAKERIAPLLKDEGFFFGTTGRRCHEA